MVDVLTRVARCAMVFVLAVGLVPTAAFADDGESEEPASGIEIELSIDGEDVESPGDHVAPDTPGVVPLDAGIPASNAALLAFDHVESSTTSKIGLAVGWNEPVCETPTAFTVQAPGGSDQCLYRLDSVNRFQTKSQYIEWVMDPSKFEYQDSPEFSVTFCASGLYRLRFSVLDKGTSPIVYESVDAWVQIDDPDHPSPEAIADRVGAECLAAGNATDFDKALWLHDWVIDNMEYDHSLTYCGAEGGLARGIGTCESYHRAYVMLLNRVGIPSGRITGNGHVWTAVKMDGEWYQVDATWDDTTQYAGYPDLRHLYFGLDDAITGLVHSDHKAPVAGYESDSLANNYFIKTGDILDWSDPVAEQILQKLEQKETSFKLAATNKNWPPNFKNVINNLVAYELNQYEWTTDGRTSDAVVRVSYADDYFTVDTFTVLPSVPSVSDGLVYNGASQVGVTVPDSGKYVLSGTAKAVNAGTYTATVTPATGYAWDKTGDRESRSYQWRIAPAPISANAVSVTGVQSTYEYTGSTIRPKAIVKHSGCVLREGTDYKVTYGNNIGVGKGTVTIQGLGKNYTGARTVSFGIAAPRDKWLTVGGKKYYYGANGQPVKWSQKIGGSWYYFNGSGVMQTGWITWKDGTKSYFDWDGRALLGWRSFSGVKYYFDQSTGISKRWSQKIDGQWYYFDGKSVMQKGWITWKDGTKSYFHPDAKGHAAALLGWRSFSGVKYYFDPATGISRRWSQRLGGYWYYFDSSSRMKTGWVTWKDGRKSYFNWDGKALTGWRSFNGVKYYFDPATGMTK